jgi:hypothetical protein
MNEGNILPFESAVESWGNLYRVVFDLQQAAPGGAAFLCIWLYADSHEAAGLKAYAIVQQLPYTVIDPNPVIFAYPSVAADDSELPGLNAEYAESEDHAKRFGLAFMFFVHTPAR